MKLCALKDLVMENVQYISLLLVWSCTVLGVKTGEFTFYCMSFQFCPFFIAIFPSRAFTQNSIVSVAVFTVKTLDDAGLRSVANVLRTSAFTKSIFLQAKHVTVTASKPLIDSKYPLMQG